MSANWRKLRPGATLGVMGGGQLGRMFAMAALQMGYRVCVLDPDPKSPAGLIATTHLCAAYDDDAALQAMGECDAVTIEFENIPVQSLLRLQQHTQLAPAPDAVAIAQDRVAEKSFARQHGIDTAPYLELKAGVDLEAPEAGVQQFSFPAILKTNRLGYDGKGQVVCENAQAAIAAFEALGGVDCVLEQRIALAAEVSVVLARGSDGQISSCPVTENIHENGILDLSIVPARVAENLQLQAREMASRLANALNYTGVLAVEFFISQDGQVLMNEMAPRPHNSGHYTLNGTTLSQFQMQVLSMCGQFLPACTSMQATVMLNILGDRWESGAPDWDKLLSQTEALPAGNKVTPHIHLYGKEEARAGRKMGHVNFLATELSIALAAATAAKVYL